MASQIAAGWNNTAGLADISKQPRMEFVNYGRQRVAGDGFVYEDGKASCTLVYDFLTEAEMNTLSGEFGVDSATSAKMTLRVESNLARAEQDYNVFIRKPNATHDRSLWVNVTFSVYGMDEI